MRSPGIAHPALRATSALALAAALATGCGAAPPPGGSPLLAAPRWAKGDSWTLKALYRPPRLGKRDPEQPAPTPAGGSSRLRTLLQRDDRLVTYWTFKVTEVEPLEGGVQGLVVQAKDKDGEKDAAASLLFARQPARGDRPAAFGLTRAKFLARPSGTPTLVRRSFREPPDMPLPVIPEDSIVPHAFPSLPALGASGAAVVFEDTRMVGELAYAFDPEQTVTTGVEAGSLEGGGAIQERLAKAGLPTRGLTLVEVFRPLDGARFRQLWAPGYPWAVYGEGPFLSFHLVYHFTAEGGAR